MWLTLFYLALRCFLPKRLCSSDEDAAESFFGGWGVSYNLLFFDMRQPWILEEISRFWVQNPMCVFCIPFFDTFLNFFFIFSLSFAKPNTVRVGKKRPQKPCFSKVSLRWWGVVGPYPRAPGSIPVRH